MQNEDPLVYKTNNKTVIVDYDFVLCSFDRNTLNHDLLIPISLKVSDLLSKVESTIRTGAIQINADTKYRKISLYITFFLLVLIFIFAIVGGATELYYFFYIAMGIFFIKTTTFTIINFVYMNPKFNDALSKMKSDCKGIISDFNSSPDIKNSKVTCGFNYARVVNEKIKVTFYKKVKVYLVFFQSLGNFEDDIEDFENAHFQMVI